MKNKILSLFLIIALLFASPLTAFAEGDGNIDNGGGGMGNGTSQNSWTPGNDGVRVTIIDAQTGKPVGTPIDYTNQSPSAGIVHFGKNSKIHYRDEPTFACYGSYQYQARLYLPRIISSGSVSASIEAIKILLFRWCCSNDCQ